MSLVGLPQCLAYAMMSGVPPAYGLVTAVVPGAVAALAGRNPFVITGPTNTTGLLILAAISPWLGENGLVSGAAGLAVVATLSLLAGLVRLAATYVGAEKLLRFFPESVLAGFTTGAAVLIVINQLDEALGLPAVSGGSVLHALRGVWDHFAAHVLPSTAAVGLAVGTAVAIGLAKRWRPRWPVALISVVVASVVAFTLGLDASAGLPVVADRAAVPTGWPEVALPTLDLEVIRGLLLPAAAIALLGTLELTVSVGASGIPTDMRREIRAQGVANVAGAFGGGFPASASLTRSALLRLGGVASRRAALLAALLVVPLLFFAAPLIEAIPLASLAGVLLITAVRMMNRERLRRLWRTAPETRILLAATLVGTLVLPLEWAIIGGAALAVAIHLHHTSEPRLRAYAAQGDGLVPLIEDPTAETVVVEVSGDLHYAAVPAFVDRVHQLVPESARHVVLDLEHAHEIRFAAADAIRRLDEELTERGADLSLAGVSDAAHEALDAAGCHSAWMPCRAVPGASLRRCVALQREDAAEPPDELP